MPGRAGWGVADTGVTRSASGKLCPGDGSQLVLITESGQVVVLDEADGRERWRASWPDVAGLAVGDLDDDGLDEMLLVSQRRLAVLGWMGEGANENATKAQNAAVERSYGTPPAEN